MEETKKFPTRTIYVPNPDVYRAAQDKAARCGRSLSSVIMELLNEWVK